MRNASDPLTLNTNPLPSNVIRRLLSLPLFVSVQRAPSEVDSSLYLQQNYIHLLL